MSSSRKLLSALALVLLVLDVESFLFGSSGSSGSSSSSSSSKSSSSGSSSGFFDRIFSSSSRRSSPTSTNTDLRDSELSSLMGSRVTTAERVSRPISSGGSSGGSVLSGIGGAFPSQLDPSRHSGVRVTLEDGSQWLVHKGDGYGRSSQTVVTNAEHMSSAWRNDGPTRDFGGSKTISDLIKTGGATYGLTTDNCHQTADRIMNQD